nr:hypothetical protein Iba_chr06fCG6570 [Ipomoea batatas]
MVSGQDFILAETVIHHKTLIFKRASQVKQKGGNEWAIWGTYVSFQENIYTEKRVYLAVKGDKSFRLLATGAISLGFLIIGRRARDQSNREELKKYGFILVAVKRVVG